MTIEEALQELDPNNDNHWTTNGAPRVDVVSTLVGVPVRREDITNTDASFTRDSLLKGEAPQEEPIAKPEEPITHTVEEKQEVIEPEPPKEATPDTNQVPDTIYVSPTDDSIEATQEPQKSNILAMPLEEIMKTEETMREYLKENMKRCCALDKEWQGIRKQAEAFYREQDLIQNHFDNTVKSVGNNLTSMIQAYLKNNTKIAQEKAARAKRFIAQGTHVEDVIKELSTESALDKGIRERNRAQRRQQTFYN